MGKNMIESIPIVVGQETDGRWWADIEMMPGVMTYGATRESAIDAVRALALRVAADCLEHGEEVPEPFGTAEAPGIGASNIPSAGVEAVEQKKAAEK